MSTEIDQDDIDLNYAREKRRSLVEYFCKEGKVPSDPNDQATMLKALSDMSKDAISKKRIKSDEKVAAGSNANVALVASLLSKFNPSMLEQATTAETIGKVPVLDLPKPVLVPGETDTNPSVETYKTFTERLGM